MKILVTGGCGYIGSVLVPMLLEEGHEVVVVDLGWWGLSKQALIFGTDCRRPSDSWGNDYDAVIHLAGMSNDPTANWNPELNWELNVEGTKAMLRWASGSGIERFVYAGTHSIYGLPDEMATEEMTGLATGPYPESKRKAEDIVLRTRYGPTEPVVLRLGTVHGVSPRMRYDLMVNTFAAACFKGQITLDCGGSYRPVLDVRDAARAFLWAATAPADVVAGETFNIAHSNMRVTRVAQLVADQYEQVYGKPVRFEEAPPRKEPRSQQISMMKALEYGFETKYGLSSRPIRDLLQLTAAVNPDEDRFHNIRHVTKLLGDALAAGGSSEAEQTGPADDRSNGLGERVEVDAAVRERDDRADDPRD